VSNQSPAAQAALAELYRRGSEAWPGVPLDAEAFARHVVARASDGELPAVERAGDVYIACACAFGEAAALQAFDRAFRDEIRRAVARLDPSPDFAEDVAQAVTERLLVRDEDATPPRIAEYAGRASLRGYLGSVAKRTALNMRRNKGDQAHDALSSGTGDAAIAVGPEMALLKARYKREFEAAIRAGMGRLPPRDRTLLLLHLVDGVTLPRLAMMQNVSRATVARWLASAREALHAETRRELLGRLRLSPSELESVTALVRSQLELSLAASLSTGAVSVIHADGEPERKR
jgi:RNA polymerase sigma-70 factor (ECF subfamily)